MLLTCSTEATELEISHQLHLPSMGGVPPHDPPEGCTILVDAGVTAVLFTK